MNFWLPRNIKLATRIQNLHPMDNTNKRITCDCQTIMGSLRRIRLCLFKKSKACPRRQPSFFFICGSFKNLSLIHEIDWISSSMVLWCFVDIVGFLMMNMLVIMLTIGTYWLSMDSTCEVFDFRNTGLIRIDTKSRYIFISILSYLVIYLI